MAIPTMHAETISPVSISEIHRCILSFGRKTMPCFIVPFLMSMSKSSESQTVSAVFIPEKKAVPKAPETKSMNIAVSMKKIFRQK